MQRYYAIFHPAPEGGYCVEFPDAKPACTQGDDLDEALAMAVDSLSTILAWGRKGREYGEASSYENVSAQAAPGDLVFPVVPDERIMSEHRPKQRVNVMLPTSQLDAIARVVAGEQGMDRSKFIAQAVDFYLGEKYRPPA